MTNVIADKLQKLQRALMAIIDISSYTVQPEILFTLSCIDEASYDALRQVVSELYGFQVNPNALKFHLKRLTELGLVERRMDWYCLTDLGKQVARIMWHLLDSEGVDLASLCGRVFRALGEKLQE